MWILYGLGLAVVSRARLAAKDGGRRGQPPSPADAANAAEARRA